MGHTTENVGKMGTFGIFDRIFPGLLGNRYVPGLGTERKEYRWQGEERQIWNNR
jgi:hypothetical protein